MFLQSTTIVLQQFMSNSECRKNCNKMGKYKLPQRIEISDKQ